MTQSRVVDVAFSYGGGAPEEQARELKERLRLAGQGFIQREAQQVNIVTGSGVISKR